MTRAGHRGQLRTTIGREHPRSLLGFREFNTRLDDLFEIHAAHFTDDRQDGFLFVFLTASIRSRIADSSLHKLLTSANPQCPQNDITVIRGVNLVQFELHTEDNCWQIRTGFGTRGVLIASLIVLSIARSCSLRINGLKIRLRLFRKEQIINVDAISGGPNTLESTDVLCIRYSHEEITVQV